MAIENLKRTNSPRIDQIRAELLEACCRKFRSVVHKLINSVWNKEKLHEE